MILNRTIYCLFLHLFFQMRLTYIFLILIPFFSTAQFADKKVYNIKKVSEKPKIDGVTNDLVWKKMNVADNFTQFKPNNGLSERSSQKTEVKICYDNQNLYFAAVMYDNAPDSILKELGKRDDEIIKVLTEDSDIRFLVLATSEEGENTGPIIKSLLSSKMKDLSIPVVLVPGSMSEKDIDSIV